MFFSTRGGRWLPTFVLLSLAFASASTSSAQVTFTVNSALDEIDDDTADSICHTAAGTCTLRAAVMQANIASGAGATILLSAATYTLIRPPIGVDGPGNGDLNFTTPVSGNPTISIVGAGEASTTIDANHIDRVLSVEAGRTATLSHLTLRNGLLAGAIQSGGGIANFGTLTLDHCAVSDNELNSPAGAGGGGIFNGGGGALHLIDSSVRGNKTITEGGGIYSLAPLFLTRSTVDTNTATGAGGGIRIIGDTLTLAGSTISRNTSHSYGGGIACASSTTIIVTNSTIVLNNADSDAGGIYADNAYIYSSTIAFNGADADNVGNDGLGGGIYVLGAGLSFVANTMVVGNTLFDFPIYDDCYGPIISYRANLFSAPGGLCTITVGGGDGWFYLNSLDLLAPLQKNGGSTETIALLPGSNAIDLGDSRLGCTGPEGPPLATDQRGVPRIAGVRCDIGAFEEGLLFFDGFETGDLSAW